MTDDRLWIAQSHEVSMQSAWDPSPWKQLLTYLRLLELPLGLLMNFGAASFKEGVRRVANNGPAPEYPRPASVT